MCPGVEMLCSEMFSEKRCSDQAGGLVWRQTGLLGNRSLLQTETHPLTGSIFHTCPCVFVAELASEPSLSFRAQDVS